MPFILQHHKNHLSIFAFLSLFTASSLAGCKINNPQDSLEQNAQLSDEAKDYVRSALVDSLGTGSSAGLDLSVLMKKNIVASMPAMTEFSASKSVFSSLSLMAQHGVGSSTDTSGGVLRVESFSLRANLVPGLLKHFGRSLPLQLNLSAQANIGVYRKFANENEAKETPPFSFIELPLTIENAQNMRLGDLIVIPLDAQVMSAVDGSFFRSTFHSGSPLRHLIGDSFLGHAQSSLRANLLVTGRFEMHLFKTDQQNIRVRILQRSDKTASAGGSASVASSAKITLLPFSKLHQVRELKRLKRIRFYGDSPVKLQDSLAQLEGKTILSDTPSASGKDPMFENEARRNKDGLVELANNLSKTAEDIQNSTIDRINSVVDEMNKNVIRKVNQPIAAIKKYSDQELRIDGQVSWNQTLVNRTQFLADYQFNLQNEAARQAYLHAVSGASTLISTNKNINRLLESTKSLLNFVLAERVVRETWHEGHPPVVRHLSASSNSTTSEGSFQIRLGQRAHYSLSENWQRDRYTIDSGLPGGAPEESSLTRWSFVQGYRFGVVSDRTATASGLVHFPSAGSPLKSFYWFAHDFEARSPQGTGLRDRFVKQSYNVLGPVAANLRLQELLKSEVEGDFRGRFFVGFSAKALEHLFSAQRVTEEHLLRATARVSASFDNTFGLPFIMFPPGLPAGVSGTPRQVDCEGMTRNWGSFYCHFMVNEVLPKFKRAQLDPQKKEWALFLESFLGRGFGANKLGADLLARVLLQALVESRGQLSGEELVIWWEARHTKSSAEELNPLVKYGNPDLISTLGEVLPPW